MDELLPWLRRSGWAYICVALALALVAWRMASGGDGGQPAGHPAAAAAVVSTAPSEGDVGDDAAGGAVVVHVAGEVRKPGVYRLRPDARVERAVARAGGATRRADLSALNLAATLQDGQQVVVPRRGTGGGATGAAGGAASAGAGAGGTVSLSRATAQELEQLDGIGPTLAARIIEWRTAHGGFASVDQLMEVSGIGPARMEALRPHLVP